MPASEIIFHSLFFSSRFSSCLLSLQVCCPLNCSSYCIVHLNETVRKERAQHIFQRQPQSCFEGLHRERVLIFTKDAVVTYWFSLKRNIFLFLVVSIAVCWMLKEGELIIFDASLLMLRYRCAGRVAHAQGNSTAVANNYYHSYYCLTFILFFI